MHIKRISGEASVQLFSLFKGKYMCTIMAARADEVATTHWWWLARFPSTVKALWVISISASWVSTD